jgi:Uri superfamily endonuclease
MKSATIKHLQSLITDETPKKTCDLLQFAIRCVRSFSIEEKVENKVDWLPMFETLWKMYPRKVNKELAKRTFEHKVRGLGEQECKDKCNLIYKAQKIAMARWEEQGTEMQYIPHYSSWLNSSVPNSPKYKGR